MFSLAEFQRAFQTSVIDAEPGAAERLGVKNVAGIDPATRLSVYQDAYWIRLIASLEEDFDGVRDMLGEHGFEGAARAYLTAYPSRSAGLMDLGLNLPKFLSENSIYRDVPGLVEQARSDWADFFAVNAERLPVKDLSGLAALDPKRQLAARLRFQAGLNLLSLANGTLAIFWGAEGLERQPLSPPEATVLEKLSGGASLGEALESWIEAGHEPAHLFKFLGRCASQGMVVGLW